MLRFFSVNNIIPPEMISESLSRSIVQVFFQGGGGTDGK